MKRWIVTFEGRVRETYLVEAETAEEARDTWHDVEPEYSDVIDGGVIDVMEDDDE